MVTEAGTTEPTKRLGRPAERALGASRGKEPAQSLRRSAGSGSVESLIESVLRALLSVQNIGNPAAINNPR